MTEGLSLNKNEVITISEDGIERIVLKVWDRYKGERQIIICEDGRYKPLLDFLWEVGAFQFYKDASILCCFLHDAGSVIRETEPLDFIDKTVGRFNIVLNLSAEHIIEMAESEINPQRPRLDLNGDTYSLKVGGKTLLTYVHELDKVMEEKDESN